MRDPEYQMQMRDFSPLQPQQLSLNEAKARTTLAQRGTGLPLQLGGQLWHVDLSPQIHSDPVSPDNWLLSVEWAGANFALLMPMATADQLAGPLLPGASLPTLPPELAQAVLEASLSEVIAALKSLGRGAPQLLEMQADAGKPHALPHSFGLRLRSVGDSAAIAATLRSDALGLLLLAGMVNKRAPAKPLLDADLPLKLPAEIGVTYLPKDLLSTLSTGDVVLMDACYVGANRVLWLSANGGGGIQVHLPAFNQTSDHDPVSEYESASPPILTVIQAWNSAMPAENTPDSPASSIDAVPIRLSFDIGEVVLTVAEARALQPGQPLSLARPLAGAVNIRANGALVGQGDLVEIDGQLGVSIRSLFAAADSDTL